LWELVRLALAGVRRTPVRVALTSTGVAIATGALVSMVGFAVGIQEQVEAPFHKSELFNRLDVTPTKREGAEVAPLDGAALGRIAAVKGVAVAYPELHLGEVEICKGGSKVKTDAGGLPREAGQLRFVQDALIAGQFFGPSGNQVILGKKLLKALGFLAPEDAVGSKLTLKVRGLSPGEGKTFQFEERVIETSIAGVWDSLNGNRRLRNEGILLPLDLLQDLPGVQFESAIERLLHGRDDSARGYGRVVVRVLHPADLFTIEQQIAEMGFRTQSFLSQFKDIRKGFILMDLVLIAVGSVALVVAALGIINTLLMAVLERYREIGTFKALGASDRDVRIIFLAEAGLVGLFGGLGGLALGRVVSWLLEIVVNAIARNRGIDEPVVFFAFPWGLLLGALLFAVVVSLISGVYPASRAARIDPIRALRSE
jgi:putative ABC transport system permease protein